VAHERTIKRLAHDVVPQRFRLCVLHDEEPIVETNVGEVVQLAVDVRDQTGPGVTRRSKRGHPVLAAGPALGEVMEYHLVREQREVSSGRGGH
jgi:hypothetical protein